MQDEQKSFVEHPPKSKNSVPKQEHRHQVSYRSHLEEKDKFDKINIFTIVITFFLQFWRPSLERLFTLLERLQQHKCNQQVAVIISIAIAIIIIITRITTSPPISPISLQS